MTSLTLSEQALQVMDRNWNNTIGYTAPNPKTYPWQWLWDSCFHAIIWTELGHPDKALQEMESLMKGMQPSGFLPHMLYTADPKGALPLWNQEGASTITQPPMFGHALAHMVRRGIDIPEHLIEKSALGLRFFIKHRLDEPSNLIRLVHPWESGADDNPRWDGYYSLEYRVPGWQEQKKALLKTILRDVNGTPAANPAFDARSPYFTALVAFNIQELASITDIIEASEADILIEGVRNSWDDSKGTWVDGGADNIETGAEVFDALLCCLVDQRQDRVNTVVDKINDETVYAGKYGPAGVSRAHRVYDGDGYWRGGVWPQMLYLMHVALQRNGRHEEATALAEQFRMGVATSNFSEHWNPDTAKPSGAQPQSWAALAVVV